MSVSGQGLTWLRLSHFIRKPLGEMIFKIPAVLLVFAYAALPCLGHINDAQEAPLYNDLVISSPISSDVVLSARFSFKCVIYPALPECRR